MAEGNPGPALSVRRMKREEVRVAHSLSPLLLDRDPLPEGAACNRPGGTRRERKRSTDTSSPDGADEVEEPPPRVRRDGA